MDLITNSNRDEQITIDNANEMIMKLLNIKSDEWPNDKKVSIKFSMKNVVDNLEITIEKK